MNINRTCRLGAPLLLVFFVIAYSPERPLQGEQLESRLQTQTHTPTIKTYSLPGRDLRRVLPPGMYLVTVPKDGDAEAKPVGSMKQGFYHAGNRADKSTPTRCDGDISQLLTDGGKIGYRCERCGKQWNTD